MFGRSEPRTPGSIAYRVLRVAGCLPHTFWHCGFDKFAERRFRLFPREINAKADSSGLGEQCVDNSTVSIVVSTRSALQTALAAVL